MDDNSSELEQQKFQLLQLAFLFFASGLAISVLGFASGSTGLVPASLSLTPTAFGLWMLAQNRRKEVHAVVREAQNDALLLPVLVAAAILAFSYSGGPNVAYDKGMVVGLIGLAYGLGVPAGWLYPKWRALTQPDP